MKSSPPSGRRQILSIRALLGLIGLVALSSAGCRRAESDRYVEKSEEPEVLPESPPLNVTSDPVKIFQKAFWRSPAADDEILHGERREWLGPDGLEKWQWFLVVKPSPGLVKYLRDDNAFGLVTADAMPEIVDPPAWFAFKTPEVRRMKAPTANLMFIFSKSGNLLYATDSGGGFRPGLPEPGKAVREGPTSSGRLPATPPPNPRLEE